MIRESGFSKLTPFLSKNVAHLKSLERFMDERALKFPANRFIRKSLQKFVHGFSKGQQRAN